MGFCYVVTYGIFSSLLNNFISVHLGVPYVPFIYAVYLVPDPRPDPHRMNFF